MLKILYIIVNQVKEKVKSIIQKKKIVKVCSNKDSKKSRSTGITKSDACAYFYERAPKYIKYIAKFIEIWYSIKELEAVILKAENLIYQGRYN